MKQVCLLLLLISGKAFAEVGDFNQIIDENDLAQRSLARAVTEAVTENEVLIQSVHLEINPNDFRENKKRKNDVSITLFKATVEAP